MPTDGEITRLLHGILAIAGWSPVRLQKELRVDSSNLYRWLKGMNPRDAGVRDAIRYLHAQVVPESLTKVPGGEANEDPLDSLDRRWRRLYEHMRGRRDALLMLLLEFEHRLLAVEMRTGIRTVASPPLDQLNEERLREAIGPDGEKPPPIMESWRDRPIASNIYR